MTVNPDFSMSAAISVRANSVGEDDPGQSVAHWRALERMVWRSPGSR